jgi:hypothetical protein
VRAPGLVHQQRDPAPLADRGDTAHVRAGAVFGRGDCLLGHDDVSLKRPQRQHPGGALVDTPPETVAGQSKRVLVLAPDPLNGVEDGITA